MERLRNSEMKSIHDFVLDCYSIHGFESYGSFVQRMVSSLSHLTQCSNVVYCEMNPEKSTSYNLASDIELMTPKAEMLWAQHMNEHPVLRYFHQTGDSRAARVSDFWSLRQLHATGLHSEVYRHYKIEDALCISTRSSSRTVTGVAWHFDRTFTDRQRLIAQLIQPHVGQALHHAKLVSRVNRQLQIFQMGIEGLSTGVILCGSRDRVQFINTQARQYLTTYFGHTAQVDHCLPEKLSLWVRRQEEMMHKKDDVPSVFLPYTQQLESHRLVARLLLQPDAKILLLIEEPAAPEASVTNTFGLTSREEQVLKWISCGKTSSEIATILQIQTGTVKKHTENIFSKLGVTTRTAAASILLLSGPNSEIH